MDSFIYLWLVLTTGSQTIQDQRDRWIERWRATTTFSLLSSFLSKATPPQFFLILPLPTFYSIFTTNYSTHEPWLKIAILGGINSWVVSPVTFSFFQFCLISIDLCERPSKTTCPNPAAQRGAARQSIHKCDRSIVYRRTILERILRQRQWRRPSRRCSESSAWGIRFALYHLVGQDFPLLINTEHARNFANHNNLWREIFQIHYQFHTATLSDH